MTDKPAIPQGTTAVYTPNKHGVHGLSKPAHYSMKKRHFGSISGYLGAMQLPRPFDFKGFLAGWSLALGLKTRKPA